jgi:hypothetical protein
MWPSNLPPFHQHPEPTALLRKGRERVDVRRHPELVQCDRNLADHPAPAIDPDLVLEDCDFHAA